MKKYYYDLHIHSCLSPCGDDDNTPNNIAGMATVSGLNIVALTDHNTAKNCPAFFEAAEKYGIIPIAGMELTTSEDIHVVCLFEHLTDALKFDEFIEKKRILIKNRPEIFGEQLIMDVDDNIVGKVESLLSNATTLSIEEIHEAVNSFGGVSYPAHIDRDSNGIISVLGTIPSDADFSFFEIHDKERISEFCERFSLDESKIIVSSDAHYLPDVADAENYFLLDTETDSAEEIRAAMFRMLRGDL